MAPKSKVCHTKESGRKLYAARDHKASEVLDVYEAKDKEASDEKLCMKPMKCKATETEKALKAV
jgi:hypothetical protein